MPSTAGAGWDEGTMDQERMVIVFITAYDDRVARDRACRAGAVDYLRKPVDDKALLDAINRAIRGS